MMKERKIVFWGAGRIATACLTYYPEISPSFIIDSNRNYYKKNNIDVIAPDVVDNYKDIFIIITVADYKEIEERLCGRGLVKGVDFEDYLSYYHLTKRTAEESLKDISTDIENGTIKKNANIILAPFWGTRGSKQITHFFSQYISEHDCDNYLIINPSYLVTREHIKKIFRCQSINISTPQIESDDDYKVFSDLNLSEREWLWKLEERKKSTCSFEDNSMVYSYYKRVFELIIPKTIIWWGNWNRHSYMVGHLAQRMNIRIKYAEYGWLPGTLQFDSAGIAGQGEFSVNNQGKQLPYVTAHKALEIMSPIRKFIQTTQLDTTIFNKNKDEYVKVDALNRNRPLFFIVGMSDEGMDIDPQSDYWKRYVSSVVSGTIEAAERIKKICEKEDWNCILKPHPSEMRNKDLEVLNENEHFIVVRDMSIDYLIQKADVVISIASAVDYKVLLYGKPLIQLGKQTLLYADCVYKVDNKDEIEKVMMRALENGFPPEQKVNYERHMAGLLQTVLWDDMSERNIRYGRPVSDNIFEE